MLAVQDVRLDPTSRQVWRGDREIRLSRKEFQLLHALMARPGDDVEQLIAVDDAPEVIHHDEAISVAVERNAALGAHARNGELQ